MEETLGHPMAAPSGMEFDGQNFHNHNTPLYIEIQSPLLPVNSVILKPLDPAKLSMAVDYEVSQGLMFSFFIEISSGWLRQVV